MVVAIAVLTLVSGCGRTNGTDDLGVGRPLAAALDYARRSDDLGVQATDTLVNTCMKNAGFDYRQSSVAVLKLETVSIPFVGYVGLDEDLSGEASSEGEDLPQLSEAEREALGGRGETQEIVVDGVSTGSIPTDGCQAAATIKLSGGIDSYKADRTLARRIYIGLNEAGREAAASPEVRELITEWAQCMQGRGLTYSSPPEVADAQPADVALRSWEDAVADIECKNETGFLATAEAAMGAAERRYVAAHPGLVTEWKELMDARYQRARDVLDGKLT